MTWWRTSPRTSEPRESKAGEGAMSLLTWPQKSLHYFHNSLLVTEMLRTECVCPNPSSYAETLIPSVMVIVVGASGNN